jgi:hypothetical protein
VKAAGGQWQDWAVRIPLSLDWCKRLRKFSSYFERDLINYQERKSHGFAITGLEAAVGISLREQRTVISPVWSVDCLPEPILG